MNTTEQNIETTTKVTDNEAREWTTPAFEQVPLKDALGNNAGLTGILTGRSNVASPVVS